MLYTLRELSEKDVINLCDGKLMGRISDLEMDGDCGRLTAVYVMPCGGFWNAGREEVRIPWENIRCVGEDAVLVEHKKEYDCTCRKTGKRSWWSG